MQEENKVKKSFLKNMKAELKKVIWPTGKQTFNNTVATIAFVLLISVILVILNFIFNFAKSELDKRIFGIEDETTTTISSESTATNVEAIEGTTSEDVSSETTDSTVVTEETENTELTESTETTESVASSEENTVTE